MSVIDLDDHRFYRLATLSNKLATPVLRKVIQQYCDDNGIIFQQLLDLYKHELFHLRRGKECCICDKRQFENVLYDIQWNKLFEDISASLQSTHPHYTCRHNPRKCPEIFRAKSGIGVDVCDVTLACALLSNITGCVGLTGKRYPIYRVIAWITSTRVAACLETCGLLEYTIDRLCTKLGANGFEQFLANYQHELFHLTGKERCCQCTSDPNIKKSITPAAWSTMYSSSPTPCTSPKCSHQYSPIPGITRTALTTQLLHKIGQAVGPVVTVRTVRNDAIAHTTTGALDEATFNAYWDELTSALHKLIDIITDVTWQTDMRAQIDTLKTCPISGEMWEEYRRNLHTYLEVCNQVLLRSEEPL